MDINTHINQEITKQIDKRFEKIEAFIKSLDSKSTPAERFYRVKELSEILGISEYTIREYITNGSLKSHRFGKIHIVSHTQLQNFLNNKNK